MTSVLKERVRAAVARRRGRRVQATPPPVTPPQATDLPFTATVGLTFNGTNTGFDTNNAEMGSLSAMPTANNGDEVTRVYLYSTNATSRIDFVLTPAVPFADAEGTPIATVEFEIVGFGSWTAGWNGTRYRVNNETAQGYIEAAEAAGNPVTFIVRVPE